MIDLPRTPLKRPGKGARQIGVWRILGPSEPDRARRGRSGGDRTHHARSGLARHTLYLNGLDPEQDRILVTGEEADHARRVKRLAQGQRVSVLNGRGWILEAEVLEAKRDLALAVVSRERAAPVSPRVEVFAPTPKGPRASDLVDALTQVGAAMWAPLECARSVVEPREGKLARLDRVSHEACKQALRPWTMDIGARTGLDDALSAPDGARLVLADADAPPYERSGAPCVRLLVGPEGGFTPEERERAAQAGAIAARFGPHVMRIEVAAPVCAAIVLDREARSGG